MIVRLNELKLNEEGVVVSFLNPLEEQTLSRFGIFLGSKIKMISKGTTCVIKILDSKFCIRHESIKNISLKIYREKNEN